MKKFMTHHPKFPNTKRKEEFLNDPKNDYFDLKNYLGVYITPPTLFDSDLPFTGDSYPESECSFFDENDWVTEVFDTQIQDLGVYGISYHGKFLFCQNVTSSEAFRIIRPVFLYLMTYSKADFIPLEEEFITVDIASTTMEISNFKTGFSGRLDYQMPHLIHHQTSRGHLVWKKGDIDLIKRAILKTESMNAEIMKRFSLIASASISFQRHEFESVIELIGRALELKFKSLRDVHISSNEWRIKRILKQLKDKKLISEETFQVANNIRHLRNKTVHSGDNYDKMLISKLLTVSKHLIAYDWIPEVFNKTKEFCINATGDWDPDQGPMVLYNDLEVCSYCGVKKLKLFDCWNITKSIPH